MRLIHCLSLLLMMPGLLAAQTSPRQASSANSSGSTSGRPVRIYTLGSKNRPSASNVLGKSNAVDSNPAPNADLQYYGGPVISNVQVVVVYWGNNVNPTTTTGIPDFFSAITNSTYLDLLSEYSTNGVNPVGGGAPGIESIGRGSMIGVYTITPSAPNSGTVVDDTQIESELLSQIEAGHLPAPTTDSNNLDTTLYMIYFPPGLTITLDGDSSCVQFCAYHSTVTRGTLAVPYGVMPDLGPTTACYTGCAEGSEFDDLTTVSSHELSESITDTAVGLAVNYAPPLAWYDVANGEVGDICNGSGQPSNQAVLPGTSYKVQKEWSNLQQDCVIAPPTFTVSAPVSAISSVPITVTLSVQSSTGVALNPPYTGTVEFTSSDGSAAFPANYTFTVADNNTHTFSNAVTLKNVGSQTITLTDTHSGGYTGSATVTVDSNAYGYFSVSGPSTAASGTSFTFTVTALNSSGNLNPAYSGTVHFTSSDPLATLPANTTLTNGVGTFPATLRTAGSQTITANDTVNSEITGMSSNVAVSPGFATHLFVIAPASVVFGTPMTFTVSAVDNSGNTSPGYTGTVHFTSSDPKATLPANSTLVNGTSAFSATLMTNGTQTITATDTATSTINGTSGSITVGGPDLIVSSFSVLTTHPETGGSLSVSDTTANQGNVSAGSSLTGFYLSIDGKTLGALFGSRSVGALAVGASSGPVTTTVTLPTNLNGPYYVIACANYNNAVVETNYANNCMTSSLIQVAGPDLTEAGVSVTGTFASGGSIQVTETVNDIAGAAPSSTTYFYLSNSANSPGTYLGGRGVPALGINGSSTATTTLTLPPGAMGGYYIVACANGNNLVKESNFANNCSGSPITVVGPDLTESSVTATGSLTSGGTIQVTDTTNDTGGEASGSTTYFYLSTSPTSTGAFLGSRGVPSLAGNTSSTATTTLTLPSGLSGTYYIVACANGNRLATESNVNNDCSASAAFTVSTLPDFTESGVSIAGTIANGGTIQVTDTTNNVGSAAPGSTTDIYLARSATSTGSYLGGHGVPALAANASSTATTAVRLPTGIPVNTTFYIVACANGNNQVKESNTNNNCSGVAFTVTH